MKATLALEPAVLAAPALAKEEQSIAKSIEAIVQLSGALRDEELGICLLSETESYLAAAGLYPGSYSISQSLAASGLSHVYTAEDIRRSVQNILQRANRLESISGVDFLIPESVATNPDLLARRVEAPLKEGLELTLAHVALVTDVVGKSSIRGLVADYYADDEIEFSANLSHITPPFLGETTRHAFACVIGVCRTAASFAEQLDADQLWQIAEDETELMAAIAVKARSIRRASGCHAPKENCEKFRMGPSFLNTMRSCQSAPSEKYGQTTFNTIARLIAGSPTEEPKKMYKLSSAGRREDVVRQDGAIGWRLHITKSGEAVRLMFWRRIDGSIELANVGLKADVNIH
ncbi:hypothetical protein [Bradyrhizobium sp. CER78]|uniref:hypothetical protein n=1 Tax=Bradyrhizobium sp. CER78 TaxID=3039162 RepID=UPI002449C64B|nr:hypothetical protein [Bradyrhizobium sp. CER78]MDH2385691.1 hypothetical protein [Bradyrhizobium sp. CER78]